MPKNKKPRKKKVAFSGARRPSNNSKKDLDKFNTQIIQFYQQGNVKEAFIASQQALKKFPNDLTLIKNAGAFAGMLGQLELAKKYMVNSLKLNPNDADTHNNLGNIFQEQKQFDQAKEHYQKALEINPNFADVHNNLGSLLQEQKQLEKAQFHYLAALKINLNYAEAYNNLGSLFNEQKQFDKAKKHYQKAFEINPNYADTQWNLSVLQLNLNNLKQGWQNYKSRYHTNKKDRESMGTTPPNIITPQYQDETLNTANKHILICPEQGVGDEVMFASVLPELKAQVQQNQNTRITLACNPRLVDLFNRSFDFLTVIPKNPDNRYQDLENDLDYWLFIGSLPKFYRNDIKDFEQHQPYLKVNEPLFSKWQDRFSQLEHKLNIGISWTGGAKAEHKRDRSLTLEQFTPILTKANQTANIINLQYGDHQQEIQNFKAQTGITIFDWEDADPLKDLDNFAAQIKALDLVISIDNSTVHFAGALGVKTFVMLPFNQDWRWSEDRGDSYWYPNVMQLFRQTEDGEWNDVIQSVTNTLDRHVNITKCPAK